MARPQTKSALLKSSQEEFDKLLDLVDSYSETERQREFPNGTLNRNIRDVLAHLHQWHLMMLNWYQVGMNGDKPKMPAKGYTWRTVPALNVEIQRKYANSELATIRELVEESYQQIRELINKHTDEELFEKKRYHWTGSTSLASYLISSSSSHYAWAYKLIKKSFKQIN